MARIIVWDPSGELVEGQLIQGPNAEQQVERRSAVVSLPCDPELMWSRGARGYFRRSWGTGWPITRNAGERVCPLTLDVVTDRPYLHWVTRIVPCGGDPIGQFRLTTDSGQSNLAGGLSAVDNPVLILRDLGKPDAAGGWTLRATSRLSTNLEGILGLSLWATARDVAVLWAAVTQTRDR